MVSVANCHAHYRRRTAGGASERSENVLNRKSQILSEDTLKFDKEKT
jgi:hypothetical protein